MLCSGCSTNIKPVVAFDIDGVLGDYHSHFMNFCRQYFGIPLEIADYNGSCDFEDWLGLTRIEYREAKLAYRQGGNKRWLPSFPGASEAVRSIRNDGVETWIATTRPWQRLDNIDPDTREWLRRAGIEFDGLLYGDDKYSQLAAAVDPERVVAVVDDLALQCRLAEKNGLLAYQVYRVSNLGDRYMPGGEFNAVIAAIKDKINQWKEKHASDIH